MLLDRSDAERGRGPQHAGRAGMVGSPQADSLPRPGIFEERLLVWRRRKYRMVQKLPTSAKPTMLIERGMFPLSVCQGINTGDDPLRVALVPPKGFAW